MNQHALQRAHRYCSNHLHLWCKSGLGRCFHCLKTVNRDEIEEWIDGVETAVCPHCGIDALIPAAAESVDISDDFFFQVMHAWFFGQDEQGD
jgi:NAD-dependent SIR2 family protein deacetylase